MSTGRLNRRIESYRGGWSTSMGGLFQDASSKSDCCALACCGLLLSDRNYYLALSEPPPAWWKRMGIYVGLPVAVVTAFFWCSAMFSTPATLVYWDASLSVTLFLLIIVLLCKAKYERIRVRRAVMTKLHAKKYSAMSTGANNDHDDGDNEDYLITAPYQGSADVDSYLQLHRHDIRAAHAMCSCYSNDIVYVHGQHLQEENDPTLLLHEQQNPADMCRCLWNTFRSSCCGYLCGAWWLCCGMCAMAQEDRELRQLLEKTDLQVDYITFEPYAAYMGKLQELRQNQEKSLWLHLKSISQLSRKLLTILACCLMWLTAVALLKLDPQFNFMNLGVVLATFSQAFLIIYFVHWNYHRFDLSLDAVIKYFSSGFVLCTFMAMVYEMMVSAVLSFFTLIIVLCGIAKDISPGMTTDEIKALQKDFARDHVAIFALFVFLNAFLVAALVEELSKYFGFWMVEHPDLMDAKEFGADSVPTHTLQVRGAATTIAMVAVAAGFACSENLLYVFVYTPPSVTNEVATLVARSLFPVHPLCAAIQSIGVVKRDLEGDKKSQLGRILFPAILLHGLFDFVLMIMALFETSSAPASPVSGGNSNTDDKDDTMSPEATSVGSSDIIPLLMSIAFVIFGSVYYGCAAASQRKRLVELGQRNVGGSETLV